MPQRLISGPAQSFSRYQVENVFPGQRKYRHTSGVSSWMTSWVQPKWAMRVKVDRRKIHAACKEV